MKKVSSWVRTLLASDSSRLSDKTRWKNEEKRSASSVKASRFFFQLPLLGYLIQHELTPHGKILSTFDSYDQGGEKNMIVRRTFAESWP